jgi:ATP-dependent Clp protease ATP-binding subunit ClpA
MPKINVYLPDDLADAVKEAGVPVSAVCQRALEQAVRRVTAVRAMALDDLDAGDLADRLPHFTARARASLTLAVGQASADGFPNVGTGHLLGGLLAEGGNLALRVLHAMEIEPDQVRGDLARAPLAEPGPVTSGRQFSGPAAGAVGLAVAEATALGHNYVGCEHLLLGLCAEPDGEAGRVLRALGAEPRATRRSVAAALAGYVHLRAQAAPEQAAPDQATTDPVRAELRALARRIERLEQQAGGAGD